MNQTAGIEGISSIDELLDTLTTNRRLAQALYRREVLELARVVGVRLTKTYQTEVQILERIREHRETELGPRPCAGCVLSGRRWYKQNQGEPLLWRLDEPALRQAHESAPEIMREAISHCSLLVPAALQREARPNELPDVTINAENLDGRGGTLGVAITYLTPDSDDLDVGRDRWISAKMTLDWSELWDADFMFTVDSHEWIHILGVDHAPAHITDDIMLPFYQRARRDYGDWTMAELRRRLIGTLPA